MSTQDRFASPSPHILVAGGDTDPNLAALISCLRKRQVSHEALLVGAESHPHVTWDLSSDVLRINGDISSPSALFIRHDVFTSLADGRPESAKRAMTWFATIAGWAYAHPEVLLCNRASAQMGTNKLHVLRLAQEVGLDVPSTLVSNDHERLLREVERRALIVKPVTGGEYTKKLSDILSGAPMMAGSLAAPAIVQEELVPPEIRVYRIDGRCFAYQLVADALDYRSMSECQVIPVALDRLPAGLTERLAMLMDRLEMNFGAADFKACPQTGRLKFLEINNSPMFVAFDRVSDGQLTEALTDFLCGPPGWLTKQGNINQRVVFRVEPSSRGVLAHRPIFMIGSFLNLQSLIGGTHGKHTLPL